MEKLNSLPGTAILMFDVVLDDLDSAIERTDIPEDLKKTLEKIRDGIGRVMQHAKEAQRERDPDFTG